MQCNLKQHAVKINHEHFKINQTPLVNISYNFLVPKNT
jgi:hypothetical protein